MKSAKKILAVLLIAILAIGNTSLVMAQEKTNPQILSLNDDYDLSNYAYSVFQKHLHALINTEELKEDVSQYSLGESFTIFNVKEKTHSTCFPVLCNSKMVAILEVNKVGREYTSTLSQSFAKELEKRLLDNEKKSFILITDGVHLQAFDGIDIDEIYQLYDDGQKSTDLSTNLDFDMSELPKHLMHSDITITQSYGLAITRGPAGPTSYKTLNVKGVSQGNHPWCWAATCAALINYYKGTSLTASTVANYVFPGNPEKGGTWTDIKKAYNHWKLYPSQTGVISFSNVKSIINSNKPMHLGLKGHSVGLIGYEDWVGAISSNDRILILLEPNGGVIKSVSLNSSGNFTYSLGGGSNAWQYTRKF